MLAVDGVDSRIAEFCKPRLAADGSPASFLPIPISTFRRDFARRDHGQQTPQSVSILRFDATVNQSLTKAVERAVRCIVFVVTTSCLYVQFLGGKLLQPKGNVRPKLLCCLLVSIGKLVNPGSN